MALFGDSKKSLPSASEVKDATKKEFDKVKDAAASRFDSVVDNAKEGYNDVKQAAKEEYNAAIDSAKRNYRNMKTDYSDAKGAVKEDYRETVDRAADKLDTVKDVASAGYDAAVDQAKQGKKLLDKAALHGEKAAERQNAFDQASIPPILD